MTFSLKIPVFMSADRHYGITLHRPRMHLHEQFLLQSYKTQRHAFL